MKEQSKKKALAKSAKKRERLARIALLKNPTVLILYIVMWLYVFSLLFLGGWLVLSSLKNPMMFELFPFALKDIPLSFENYVTAYNKLFVQLPSSAEKIYFLGLFYNGLSYALLSPLPGLFINACTAYICAKFKSPLTKIIYGVVIVTMFIPLVGTTPATLLLYKKLKIYDSLIGILITHAGFGGTYFLVLTGCFGAVPDSLSEAAKIDGASEARVMFSINFRMVMTTMVGIYILNFIAAWNDFNTPLMYLPSRPTLAYGLWIFKSSSDSYVSQIPVQLSAVVLSMIPIVIIFVCLKKKIMGNLVVGGVKG